MTTTAAVTHSATRRARDLIREARRHGWTAHRVCGSLRTRFHRGNEVVSVDWMRNGTVAYADRHVADERHGHSLAAVPGYWVTDDVRDFHSTNKRQAVTRWLLAPAA